MRVLSLDPGSANFGYSIVDIDKDNIEIQEIGQILNTITNLTATTTYRKPTKAQRDRAKKKGVRIKKEDKKSEPPLDVGLARFIKSISGILKDYKPEHVVVERFQSRGLKGATVECIAIMLGVLLTLCYKSKISVRLITAAQWKNEINKHLALDTLYPQTAALGFSAHETDTLGMCCYYSNTIEEGTILWFPKILTPLEIYTKKI